MKWIRIILFSLLVLYSVALIWMDVQLGQNYVRGIFSDIITGTDHPLPYRAFFGLNTTLVVVMLMGAALLFSVSARCSARQGVRGRVLFFQGSQIIFFIYLACDERLLIHEKMASLLGVNDAFLILGLGLVELLLLFSAGEIIKQPWKLKAGVFSAGAFFGLMVLIDALGPECMDGRLALEDLAKTWAVAFLLIYAWEYCLDWIFTSAGRESDGP